VNAKFLNLINRRGGRTETKSAQSFWSYDVSA
jgi:hypothetical protein